MHANAVTRRDFVKTAASLASFAAIPAWAQVPGAPAAPAGGQKSADVQVAPQPSSQPATQPASIARPRISCVSWCFHGFEPGASPEQAIDTIGQLGFEGLELICHARNDLQAFWTTDRIDQTRRQLDRHHLAIAQWVLFQPVVEDLTSPDRTARERSLDAFEAGCRIGQRLGAPLINIVAPWSRELKGPSDYLPRYYEIADPKPNEKFHIDIAAGFDWPRIWESFISTVRACLERAKAHGLKLTIEHHTHTLIPTADAFLRLADAIRDPALGFNIDAGWTLSQREYPPVAIHKTRSQLMNLHLRDIDGLMHRFVHVGEGVMDFEAIAKTLVAINFTGFCSLEQDKHPGDMRATCARYLRMMKEYLGV